MLEMRNECEHCQAPLAAESTEAFICSFECTWCRACANTFEHACPNCGGELVARPTRRVG
ncbi:MAG: DUF1272 domain-containing protein [Actinomycetota bacterium]